MHDIVLNFYTTDEVVYNNPPQLLKQSIPEWWHDLPPKYINEEVYGDMPKSTMKSCDGFNQFFSNGFTISFPEDIVFNVGKNIEEGITSEYDKFEVHVSQQRGSFLNKENYQHIKLLYPWFIECEEEVKFVFLANTWCIDKPEDVIIPPGVVDFVTQYAAHVNMFIPFNTSRIVKIPAKSQFVALIPLSDRKLQLNCHLIDKLEYDKRVTNSYHFKRALHRHNKDVIKHFGCPFHLPETK